MGTTRGRVDSTSGDPGIIQPNDLHATVFDAHTGLMIPWNRIVRNPRGPGYRDAIYLKYWLPITQFPDPEIDIEDETGDATTQTLAANRPY